MKKAVLLGHQRAGVVDVADPVPRGEWADTGHEGAGEVVAVAQPGPVEPGARVVVMPGFACGQCALCLAGDVVYCSAPLDFAAIHGTADGQGTAAQYLLKPMRLLQSIPDGVSYDHAALACCALGPSFGAFEAIGLDASHTVLVTGLGPVGLGAVVNARFRGARVIGVESAAWRADRALQLGATHMLDPHAKDLVNAIRDLTGGHGVDRALDCSGAIAAHRLCIDATRTLGKVAFVANCGERLAISTELDLVAKRLTLVGSAHYNLNAFPRVMQVIQQSPAIRLLISHVMPISAIEHALKLGAAGSTAKVVLHPWD